MVSSDIVGNPCPSIYDVNATKLSSDGQSLTLYIWYDNEYGYSRQVLRLAKYLPEYEDRYIIKIPGLLLPLT